MRNFCKLLKITPYGSKEELCNNIRYILDKDYKDSKDSKDTLDKEQQKDHITKQTEKQNTKQKEQTTSNKKYYIPEIQERIITKRHFIPNLI